MSEILRGAPAAAALDEETTSRAIMLRVKGVVPTLAILRVGERADDVSYERAAIKRAAKVGVETKNIVLSKNTSQDMLFEEIEKLNADKSVHGVLMFRPLPNTIDEYAACAALTPEKDVDGISFKSMAQLYSGIGAGYAPCTAQSVMELLKYYAVELSGKRAVIVGRSLVIGRPVAMLLMEANATVTLCHSKTARLQEVMREADIVVAALGRAEMLGAEYFRTGQTVIDVGVNWSEKKQKFVGDVDFDAVLPKVRAITPVPGGVGSVTTAVLCRHIVEAAERAV
jgi:methylenetetrahydrofolate dehydrogenase (NADP+)/methenyltetrahydrofolate cyclohydrolase